MLVQTDWSRHWGTTAYFTGSPFLTANVAVVGIDSLNIDDVDDLTRPVHDTLLGAGIPVLEHLTNLGAVPDTGDACISCPH